MKHFLAWRVLLAAGLAAFSMGCRDGHLSGDAESGIDEAGVPSAVIPPARERGAQAQPMVTAPVAPVAAAAKPAAASKAQPGEAERLDYARRAEKLLAAKPTEDPGREYVNRLRTSWNVPLLELVKDVEREIPQEEMWTWESFKLSVEMGEKGAAWPVPGKVIVPRVPVGERLVLDGDLSDPAWEKAFTWDKSYAFNSLKESEATKTVWKLLWDADYLYVGFGCVDEDVVSVPRARDDTAYQDDSVELYLSPDGRFRGYWEVVVNADNSVFDAIEVKKLMEWGLDADLQADVKGLVTVVKREGPGGKPGYCVEMAMPWSAVLAQAGQRPRIGDAFEFMLVRIQKGSDGREGVGHAPVPVMGWAHNIWNRAKMELGE